MSLWYKPAKEITFQNVDAFLQTNQPEGHRLEYKGVGFPDDLNKTIAAFANTLGGMIILGVAADKTTNCPVWPPTQGMPTKPGLEERVLQIARESIYPAVRVSVSQVINNEKLPGHSIVVIRVDESPTAPHAIDSKKKIYICERDGSTGKTCSLADIDRIEHLLERRAKYDSQRVQLIQVARQRAGRVYTKHHPSCWISIIPFFPWRDIWNVADCLEWLRTLETAMTTQRVPGGAAALSPYQKIGEDSCQTRFSMLTANGHVFAMKWMEESDNWAKATDEVFKALMLPARPLAYPVAKQFFEGYIEFARNCYQRIDRVEFPGLILVTLGLLRIRNYSAVPPFPPGRQVELFSNKPGRPLLDDEFSEEEMMTAEEFIDGDALKRLFQRFEYGLDLLSGVP